jgi:hypothetical protein
VIQSLKQILESMDVPQYLMAFLFLGCYCMSLSQFVGARARHWAVAGAATAAVAFIASCDPWEHGVLLVACTLVALGGFAASAWLLWALFGWPEAAASASPDTDLCLEETHAPAPPPDWAGPPLLAGIAALRRQLKPMFFGQASR